MDLSGNVNWNSSKLPETLSENNQKIQQDTASILLNLITIMGKKPIAQSLLNNL